MLLNLNRFSPSSFRSESGKLVSLALPMLLAQIASVGVGVVDTVMAGRASKDDLAAVALGSAVFATVFITFLGIMTALNPMIAQQHGAGEQGEIGETGRQGMWFGLGLGAAGMLLMMALIKPLQGYLAGKGYGAYVLDTLGDYLFYVALAMPAAMVYRALYAYASSLDRPKPLMWTSWAALLLNVPLNYVFVYGKFGLPAMGGAGCGLATALVFWFSAVALGGHIVRNPYFAAFGLTARFSLPHKAAQRRIWQLGWPIGLSYFLEASLFTLIVWLIANFGQDTVSAQQVVISITSVVYMVPSAVGAATTVRIGFALGRRQFARARYIAGVSLAMGWALALLTLTVLVLFRRPLASFYTGDAAVIAIAANILLFAAVFQFFDFTQCIASYALRGYKITRAPMIIHGIAFWGLGLLPGYLLAHHAGMGVYSFWAALIASLAAAAVALVWYLEKCSRWAQQHRAL